MELRRYTRVCFWVRSPKSAINGGISGIIWNKYYKPHKHIWRLTWAANYSSAVSEKEQTWFSWAFFFFLSSAVERKWEDRPTGKLSKHGSDSFETHSLQQKCTSEDHRCPLLDTATPPTSAIHPRSDTWSTICTVKWCFSGVWRFNVCANWRSAICHSWRASTARVLFGGTRLRLYIGLDSSDTHMGKRIYTHRASASWFKVFNQVHFFHLLLCKANNL